MCLCVCACTLKQMHECVCINFLPPKKVPCARNMDERRNEKEVASIIIGHMHYTQQHIQCKHEATAACHLFQPPSAFAFFYAQAEAMLFTDYPFHNWVLRLYSFLHSSLFCSLSLFKIWKLMCSLLHTFTQKSVSTGHFQRKLAINLDCKYERISNKNLKCCTKFH